tara:strand:- start:513 stop:884 length:372 start_codon:yes stop_codon:yes gene_type:complete
MENLKIENYLSGWEDEEREGIRDFINFMNSGFESKLDLNQNLIKDKLEYQNKVYKYYIFDVIKNHVLLSLLINDREDGGKTFSGVSVEELIKKVNYKSTRMYNRCVLEKDKHEWNSKLNFDNF